MTDTRICSMHLQPEGDNGVWLPLARYQVDNKRAKPSLPEQCWKARRELNLADVEPGEDPQAKDARTGHWPVARGSHTHRQIIFELWVALSFVSGRILWPSARVS